MRSVIAVLVQIIVTVLIVGALMPMILLTLPAAQGARSGMTMTAVLLLGIFILVRLAWPKPRNG